MTGILAKEGASGCRLCTASSGEFNWGNVCCRARFVIGLPGIDWRRGWMARWKARERVEFYDEITLAVKAAWELKSAGMGVCS